MHTIKLCGISSVIASGALLGGCHEHSWSDSGAVGNAAEKPDGDVASKTLYEPNLNDISAAVAWVHGDCALWSMCVIRRNDGAPNIEGYEISNSLAPDFQDGGRLGCYAELGRGRSRWMSDGSGDAYPSVEGYESSPFAASGDGSLFALNEDGICRQEPAFSRIKAPSIGLHPSTNQPVRLRSRNSLTFTNHFDRAMFCGHAVRSERQQSYFHKQNEKCGLVATKRRTR